MEKGEYLEKLDYEYESHSYEEDQPQIQPSGLLHNFDFYQSNASYYFTKNPSGK